MRVAVRERYRSGRELLDASKTARRSSPGHGGCEVGDGAVESAGRWLLPTSTTPRLSVTQPHLPNTHCTRRTYSSLPLSVSPPLCFFFPPVHPHPSSFILSATSPSALGSLPGCPFSTVGNYGNGRLRSGPALCCSEHSVLGNRLPALHDESSYPSSPSLHSPSANHPPPLRVACVWRPLTTRMGRLAPGGVWNEGERKGCFRPRVLSFSMC
ncbi:hypothetical protein IWZ00DRAFT_299626 [Phyllosticta capitalensis]